MLEALDTEEELVVETLNGDVTVVLSPPSSNNRSFRPSQLFGSLIAACRSIFSAAAVPLNLQFRKLGSTIEPTSCNDSGKKLLSVPYAVVFNPGIDQLPALLKPNKKFTLSSLSRQYKKIESTPLLLLPKSNTPSSLVQAAFCP